MTVSAPSASTTPPGSAASQPPAPSEYSTVLLYAYAVSPRFVSTYPCAAGSVPYAQLTFNPAGSIPIAPSVSVVTGITAEFVPSTPSRFDRNRM